MQIIEWQWNMLNEDQKRIFQDELGKYFSKGVYPSRNDILIFLGNNRYENTGFKELKRHETPTAVNKETDELWEDVVNHFISKEK